MKDDDLKEFEKTMIERGYPADDFDGFEAEGEWAYYSKTANCMYSAWCAAREKKA